MKVVLTGATGAIGLSLIEVLLERNFKVLVLASPGSPRNVKLEEYNCPDFSWLECGLDSYDSFQLSERYDCMLHMAWTGGLDRWNVDLNLSSARHCAAAVRLAARLGCHTFLATGSQAECGPQTAPISPDTVCLPDTPFGIAKNLAYHLARMEARRATNLRFIWARILSVYGPRDRESSMIITALRQLMRGDLPAFSSGEQLWDFLYVRDAANALADMLELGRDDQIYVLGSGRPLPLKSYLEILLAPFGIDPKLCIGKAERVVTTTQFLAADIKLLHEHLGWSPIVGFEDGVQWTMEYCRKFPDL